MKLASANALFVFVLACATVCASALAQEPGVTPPEKPVEKTASPKKSVSSEQADLQKAIADAGVDRAALVQTLEAFLTKYPESSQRPQIYRAIVESSLQLRDFPRATNYA